MFSNRNLYKNIPNNYIFTFLSNLNLTHGLWMIYLATKGMSLVELGMLEGIFHITSFLMEVPTGLIADLYGRKTSRTLGRILAIFSIALLLLSNSFLYFALSFILIALSYNLESGAGEALIYDSLKELKMEKDYMKICGRQEVAFQLGQIIAFLLGGYLATISYKYVFYLTIFFILLTIIQSFMFIEPNFEKEDISNKKVKQVLVTQISQSASVLKNNRKIGFFIIFTQVILSFGTSLFFYLQNFWISNGHTEFFIGVIFSVSAIFEGLTGALTYKLEKIIKERGILMIMPFIAVICIWFIAISKYSFIFYILLAGVENFIFVAMSDYINKLIPSKNRATILSLASMVFSFFMIFIFPLIGKIGDIYSLKLSFIVTAFIASIFAIGNLVFLLKLEKKKTA